MDIKRSASIRRSTTHIHSYHSADAAAIFNISEVVKKDNAPIIYKLS